MGAIQKTMKTNILLLLFITLIMTGCATRQTSAQVKSFSLASTELSDQIIQAYELTNKTTIERKIYEIALLPANEVALLNNDDIDNIKGLMENKKNINSIKALKSYSKALGDLSSADFKSDMDKASTDFYGSLASLEKTYQSLSKKEFNIHNEEFAILTTLVNTIGSRVSENKREKAIKEIIIKTDPFISRVSDEIYNNIGDREDLILANLSSTYNDKILIYRTAVKNGKIKNIDTRIKKIKELVEYSNNYRKTASIFKDIKKVVKKVEKAHHALYLAVTSDEESNDFKKEISELVSYSKEIKTYYKSLLN
ncbi:MAG: hypothetical protein HRT43_12795 [Campylobacteraceae bacterium]|nr:hypothetical protein [Campylobacteraceae bacterium]